MQANHLQKKCFRFYNKIPEIIILVLNNEKDFFFWQGFHKEYVVIISVTTELLR
jgi:hypothetical protein